MIEVLSHMFSKIRHIFFGKTTLDEAVEQATINTTKNIMIHSEYYETYNAIIYDVTEQVVFHVIHKDIHNAMFEATIHPINEAIEQAIK